MNENNINENLKNNEAIEKMEPINGLYKCHSSKNDKSLTYDDTKHLFMILLNFFCHNFFL